MSNEKCDLQTVLRFVDRTVAKGVPVRVAIARASKRFRMDRNLIRGFYRAPYEQDETEFQPRRSGHSPRPKES